MERKRMDGCRKEAGMTVEGASGNRWFLTDDEIEELLRDLPLQIAFPARDARMVYRKTS